MFREHQLLLTLERCLLVQNLLLQNKSRVIINELIEDMSRLCHYPVKTYNITDRVHQHLLNSPMLTHQDISNTAHLYNNNMYSNIHHNNELQQSQVLFPQISIKPYPPSFDSFTSNNDAKDI